LKRNAIRKDGKMPIITRITVDGIIGQFNTKLEIQPNYWSVKNRESYWASLLIVSSTMLNWKRSRLPFIAFIMNNNEKIISDCWKSEKWFLGISENHENLLSLFQKHNWGCQKNLSESANQHGTYQKYEVTRRHLQKFMNSNIRLPTLLKRLNIYL